MSDPVMEFPSNSQKSQDFLTILKTLGLISMSWLQISRKFRKEIKGTKGMKGTKGEGD